MADCVCECRAGKKTLRCTVILAVKTFNITSMEWAACCVVGDIMNLLVEGYMACKYDRSCSRKEVVPECLPTVFGVLYNCQDLSECLQKWYCNGRRVPIWMFDVVLMDFTLRCTDKISGQ